MDNTRNFPAETYPSAPQTNDDEGLYLVAILKAIWRHKLIVFLCVLIGMAGTVALINVLPERFSASSKLLMGANSPRITRAQDIFQSIANDEAAMLSEIEVIQSTPLIMQLTENLELQAREEFNPDLGEKPLKERAFNYVEDLYYQGYELIFPSNPNGAVRGGDEEVVQPERNLLKKRSAILAEVADNIAVDIVPDSQVVSITANSQDPQVAAAMANRLANLYLEQQVQSKVSKSERATEWLQDQVNSLRKQVEESERAVERYRESAGLVEARGTTLVSQQVAEVNSELIAAQTRRAEAEARLAQAQSLVNQGGADTAAEVLDSGLIQALLREQSALERQRADLSNELGARHPRMVSLTSEIADLDQKIQSEVNKIVQSLRNEVGVARARERALEQRLRELEGRSGNLSQKEVEMRALVREAEANRGLLESFLTQLKEVSSSTELQQADARIVELAETPLAPVFPPKMLFLGGSAVIFMLLGVTIVLIMEYSDQRLRNLEDMEHVTNNENVMLLPQLQSKRLKFDQWDQEPRNFKQSLYRETIRSIALSLLFMREEAAKVVMVISSVPSEGKSTTSAALAHHAVFSKSRVLLIDMDLRRPNVHNLCRISQAPGIADLVRGDCTLEQAVHINERTGLHVIPAGRSRFNDLDEILSSQRLAALITELRSQYDLIVIDTPPITVISDALLMTKLADAAVFVARWRYAGARLIRKSLTMLKEANLPIAAHVLSMADMKMLQSYSQQSSSYGYNFSSKYYNKMKKSA